MMRRLGPRPILSSVLAAVCLLLATVVYQDFRRLGDPVSLPERENNASGAPAQLSGTSLEPPLLQAFSVSIERPAFSPTRRPAEAAPPVPVEAAEPEAPAPPPAPSIDFTLAGLVLDENERIALVRQSNGQIQSVREGGDVLGWTVTLIEPDGAVFRHGETDEVLVLRYYPSPSLPSQTSPGGPVAAPAAQPQPAVSAPPAIAPP